MEPLKHLSCLNVKHQQIGSQVQTYNTFPKESGGFEGGPQNDSKTFPNQMSFTKCKITNTAQWAFTGNDERTQHTAGWTTSCWRSNELSDLMHTWRSEHTVRKINDSLICSSVGAPLFLIQLSSSSAHLLNNTTQLGPCLASNQIS